MNPIYASRIVYENLRSVSFGSITGSYASIGVPFENPIRILRVTNTTDVVILVSFDGVNDKDVSPNKTAYVYDYCSNASDQGGYAEQSAGTTVYIKAESSLPTVGKIYITAIYVSAT